MKEIDYISIEPDSFGWKVRIEIAGDMDGGTIYYGIGDAMQWVHETERTLGRWLADGPADFHTIGELEAERDVSDRAAAEWATLLAETQIERDGLRARVSELQEGLETMDRFARSVTSVSSETLRHTIATLLYDGADPDLVRDLERGK